MNAIDLYDSDFAEWAQRNAELLRSGRADEADLGHIAEEIEDMGKRERRGLHNRLVRLIEHLLKWNLQPERRGAGWGRTIVIQRRAIKRLLKENPSFNAAFDDVIAEAYDDAVAIVAAVLRRSRADFSATCPYSRPNLLDEEFFG